MVIIFEIGVGDYSPGADGADGAWSMALSITAVFVGV